MGPIYSLEDVIDMLRRRAMLIFGITVLGAVAVIFMALSNAHEYESTEVIQIQRAKIAGQLTPSVIEGSSGRRLQSVQHQLTSRGALFEIVDKYDLFSDIPALSPDEKAQALRNGIVITGVPAVSDGAADDGSLSVLSITVRLGSAEDAQLVAREMSARTIELYAARRIEEARATLQFFADQEEGLFREVQMLEDEIAEFRASQELSLPGSVEFRRSQIAALNSAILDVERERISVERQLDQANRDTDTQRQVTVQREIRSLETQRLNLEEQQALLDARLAALTASIETSPEVERQLTAYDREMDLLREQLRVVTTNRAEAEIGLRLELERQAEQLVVLEPASLPIHPVTPSRKRNVIVGTAAVSAVAVIIAFLLELRNPVIRTAAQMEREMGIAPVITLPNVTVARRKPGRLRRMFAWFSGKVPVEAKPDDPPTLRHGS